MIMDLDLFWGGWNKSGYSINYPLIIRQCGLNYPLIKNGCLNAAFSFNFSLFSLLLKQELGTLLLSSCYGCYLLCGI